MPRAGRYEPAYPLAGGRTAPPEAPPLLHNGDPEDPYWWTGVLGHTLHIPANLTRGLSIIINPLVRLPWEFNGEPPPPWAVDPMLMNGRSTTGGMPARPFMARESHFDFWSRWIRDAILYGLGLFSYQTLADGITPETGSLIRHDPRELLAPADDTVTDWVLVWNGARHDVDENGKFSNRRLHFLRGHSGGIFGQHATELRAAEGVTNYAATLFDGNVPSGVLTTDMSLTQDQADTARTEWESRQYRRRIAVLSNGAKYQQVVMSPVDAAVGAMMLLTNTQIAHMLELPAWMLDGQSGTSMTYSNINDQRQDFVDGTLSAWSARVEESMSALLPWGQTMAIDFSEYRRPTMTVATGAATNIATAAQEGAPDAPPTA